MAGDDTPPDPFEGNSRNRQYENFTYDHTDTAPYRVYFELRNKTYGKDAEKINKYSLGSTLKEIGNVKQFVTDMKYVGQHKIIVFLNNYGKANLLVQTINKEQGKYKAYVPKHLVCISGVVAGVPVDIDVEEIKREIECEVPIVDIRRMTRFQEGTGKIPIARLCVTFRAHELPANVRLLCCFGRVMPFKSKVVICLKCLRFGHRTENCRGAMRCSKCTERHEQPADFQNCQNAIKCVHCRSTEHESTDEKCPERKRQMEIRTLMSKRNITYTEAREQISVISQNLYEPLQNIEEFPTPKESFASMTKGQYKWKDPLKQQWINANMERKAIKPALKTYDNPKPDNRKRFKPNQTNSTAASQITEQRNIIIEQSSNENSNGTALQNQHYVTEKERWEQMLHEAQATMARAQQEAMMSFYADFIGMLGDQEEIENMFKLCTKKHFNLANTVVGQHSTESEEYMDIPLPDE